MKKKENFWSLATSCKKSLKDKPFVCLSACNNDNITNSLPFSTKLLNKFCRNVYRVDDLFKGPTYSLYDKNLNFIIAFIKENPVDFIPLILFEYGKLDSYNISYVLNKKKKLNDFFFISKRLSRKLSTLLNFSYKKLILILSKKYANFKSISFS